MWLHDPHIHPSYVCGLVVWVCVWGLGVDRLIAPPRNIHFIPFPFLYMRKVSDALLRWCVDDSGRFAYCWRFRYIRLCGGYTLPSRSLPFQLQTTEWIFVECSDYKLMYVCVRANKEMYIKLDAKQINVRLQMCENRRLQSY